MKVRAFLLHVTAGTLIQNKEVVTQVEGFYQIISRLTHLHILSEELRDTSGSQ